jgi:hypothetical protein
MLGTATFQKILGKAMFITLIVLLIIICKVVGGLTFLDPL